MQVSAQGPLGRVLSVSGSQAQVRLSVNGEEARPTVGKFLGIRADGAMVVGVITKIAADEKGGDGIATCQLDLLGEIKDDGRTYFQRGVTEYPVIGDGVNLITQRELKLIFDMSGPGTIDIGTLQQDQSIPAYINVDDMVRKHFAVFGTTGVGKSSGVALLVRQILDARPDLRVFLIDPHNEYGHCFDDRAQVLSPKNLKLPFWVFNFEEIVDVFFRGRPGVDEEVEILSELIPIAKSIFTPNNGPATRRIVRNDPKSSGVTVDTPVPYRLEDLIRLIDERMGKLENRSAWARYHRLITRIETARNDPRYGFMFDNANVGGDTMVETLSTLFRLPPNGMPMTIMQLAGFPAEVVELGRLGAAAHGVRVRPVERRRVPAALRLRGSAPLRAGGPLGRLRADPQGGLAHRQGGPQVRRVPRPDHAAPGRARRDHHLAMLDAVRDAHGERPRPGDRALGGVGRGRLADRLRPLARHPRGVRVRRRRRAADPPALQGARAGTTSRTARRSPAPAWIRRAVSTSASSSRWWSAGAAPPWAARRARVPRSAAAAAIRDDDSAISIRSPAASSRACARPPARSRHCSGARAAAPAPRPIPPARTRSSSR